VLQVLLWGAAGGMGGCCDVKTKQEILVLMDGGEDDYDHIHAHGQHMVGKCIWVCTVV
jgi:hypothetical protein